MPKFHRQNKKRIDPRYFLNETTDRDLNEDINDDDDLSLKYILKFTDNGRARPEFEEIERKFTNDRIVQFAIADILRIASNQKRDLEIIRQAQRILMNMQYGDAAAEELLRAINHCRKG